MIIAFCKDKLTKSRPGKSKNYCKKRGNLKNKSYFLRFNA